MSSVAQVGKSDTRFFRALMKHIMKGVNVPKFQVERVIGPILGMFIEDVMSSLLKEKVITLSAEFPIRKFAEAHQEQNNQSTNIDWLMYGKKSNSLIFVELKTTDAAFRSVQASLYKSLQGKIKKDCASFLLKDIEAITQASKESGKYKNITARIAKAKINFAEINSSRIIYLLPEAAKIKISPDGKAGIEFYSFGGLQLKESMKNPFREHWKVLHSSLRKLDKITQVSRNEPLRRGATFDDICSESKCKPIYVGFVGGLSKLRSSNLSGLKKRKYKWDTHLDGIKQTKNWVAGSDFLAALAEIATREAL